MHEKIILTIISQFSKVFSVPDILLLVIVKNSSSNSKTVVAWVSVTLGDQYCNKRPRGAQNAFSWNILGFFPKSRHVLDYSCRPLKKKTYLKNKKNNKSSYAKPDLKSPEIKKKK